MHVSTPSKHAGQPPRPREIGPVNWLGLWTLYQKEVRRFLKVMIQTVLAPVVTTLLFLAIFTLAVGRAIDLGGGIGFAEFLAPGLVIMTVMQNAFQNTASTIMIGKVQGNIVDVLMPPLGPGELLAAFAGGGVTRGILVGLTTGTVMHFAVGFAFTNVLIALGFLLAAALAMSFLGVLAGLWAEKFDQLATVTNFVIQPLAFLSGTFYSIDRLPGIWNDLAHLNPLFYMIDGFRHGMIGWSDTDPWIGALVLLGTNVFLALLCLRLLSTGYRIKP